MVDRAGGDISVTEEQLEKLRLLGNDLEIEKDRRFTLAKICAHACHSNPGVALRAIKAEVDSATRAFHLKSYEAVAAVDEIFAGGAGGEMEAIRSSAGGVGTDDSETDPQPKKRPRRSDND